MKIKISMATMVILFLIMTGCATSQKSVQTKKAQSQKVQALAKKPTPSKTLSRGRARTDKSGFRIKPVELEIQAGRAYLPVGAEIISKKGKVPLIQVIKKLADLKGFSVSWANDVDSKQTIDVHIRPEDNFWEALDNTLRQLDYFYEMDRDTIVVKYKETKRYQLVMPNLKEDFKTSIGGNLIGTAGEEGQITGQTSLEANVSEPLDFWTTVGENIDRIINAGGRTISQETTTQQAAEEQGAEEQLSGQEATAQQTTTQQIPSYDKGYYIMDKHLGIITVTAPKKTHQQIKAYLDNLKKVMYRQVIIEAKIVEVILDDDFKFGINWENFLTMNFIANFRQNIYPRAGQKLFTSITVQHSDGTTSLGAIVEALKTYGKTHILSNPKITLMNGHGASITVGENRTYVDKVESTADDVGNITYTVTTSSVLSGLGLAVMANIINDDEVILYLVPVTTELQSYSSTEAIEYKTFGNAQVGLPRVKLREMATMAKVRNGETLIIGGQISQKRTETTKSVPLLGDIPGLGWLFKHKSTSIDNTELVIFLKPTIVSGLEK